MVLHIPPGTIKQKPDEYMGLALQSAAPAHAHCIQMVDIQKRKSPSEGMKTDRLCKIAQPWRRSNSVKDKAGNEKHGNFLLLS